MELGFNFDDDDFAEARQKKTVPLSYNAKICGPKWFLDDASLEGSDDKVTVWKLRADYYFNTKKYARAADCFQQSLDSLGSQNRSMRREIVESMARCFIHMGNPTKALEYADKMVADCLTSAHLCQALILQQQVHQNAGNTLDEIAVLYQLIQLHSFHYPFWKSLAEAYRKQEGRDQLVSNKLPNLKLSCKCSEPDLDEEGNSGNTDSAISLIDENKSESDCQKDHGIKDTLQSDTETKYLCNKGNNASDSYTLGGETIKNRNHTCSKGMNSQVQDVSDGQVSHVNVGMNDLGISDSHQVEGDDGDKLFGYPCKLLILTCLVRVKLILQSNCRNVGSFIKDKNLQRLRETEQQIQAITSDEHILKTVTEFMRRDMFDDGFEETSSEENIDIKGADRGVAQSEEFIKKWFSWISHLN